MLSEIGQDLSNEHKKRLGKKISEKLKGRTIANGGRKPSKTLATGRKVGSGGNRMQTANRIQVGRLGWREATVVMVEGVSSFFGRPGPLVGFLILLYSSVGIFPTPYIA